MTNEEFDLAASRAFYLLVWRKALRELLGWTEERALKWAREYAPDMQEEESGFYRETPIYYVAPELIPDSLGGRLNGAERHELALRLQWAIEKGGLPPLPRALVESRTAPPTFEWMRKVNEFNAQSIENGFGLYPQDLGAFDWAAAQGRVDKVLDEYREANNANRGGP